MKKLIMAVAVVLAVAGAKAAAIDWGITGVTSSPDNTAAAGMLAYFVDGSQYDAFSALTGTDVTAFLADEANVIGSANTVLVKGSRGKPDSINATAKQGTFAASADASFFVVLLDTGSTATAKYYAYTEKGSVHIGDAGADGSYSFGDFTTATAANGGWTQLESVPEPTSGLLMLLGMAGLALRRRRA